MSFQVIDEILGCVAKESTSSKLKHLVLGVVVHDEDLGGQLAKCSKSHWCEIQQQQSIVIS
jgi:hypothetical protein